MSTVICMWSGPRNLSTAMMRSFGSRSDCQVWDEPFFAPFLKATGKAHPGRDETLARHETDAVKVAAQCRAPIEATYHFQKHMPHHMIDGVPMEWTVDAKHFFLLRDPARVIASYAKGRDAFDLEDLGFASQARVFNRLSDQAQIAPPIIASSDILKSPEKALSALCAAIDIPFDKAMLSWARGPRAEDGAWAPYWYGSVEASTGFSQTSKAVPDVCEKHKDILGACEAEYRPMFEKRLRI